MITSNASNGSSPLSSIDDLILHFAQGEKTQDRFKIGTEHEKMIFLKQTHQPVPYEGPRGIGAVLEAFRTKFAWDPVFEGENLIALTRDEASITLEPGGQLELSGAPLDSSHDTCGEMGRHLRETREITEELDLLMLNLGRNPSIPSGQMPWSGTLPLSSSDIHGEAGAEGVTWSSLPPFFWLGLPEETSS